MPRNTGEYFRYTGITSEDTNFLNVGFYPQVKEFIYEDVNTILSFEDNIDM